MSDSKVDFLRLARVERVGAVSFARLISKYGNAAAALEYLVSQKNVAIPPVSEIEKDLAAAEQAGTRVMLSSDADYPLLLKQLPDCPPVLYAVGDAAAMSERCVAMVGSRNASLPSRKFAEKLACDLCSAGICVVSGMAIGIDTSAHFGALNAGGKTVAVMGGGVDEIYPPSNRDLYRRIADNGGCVISEMPMGTSPAAPLFPRRNRIVSGLSLGTVVVEASIKSGSLITARFAAEQGREVFAVPNFPLDPRALGCNDLIKNGATLVDSVADILDGIGNYTLREPDLFGVAEEPPLADYEGLKGEILEVLSGVPVTLNELFREFCGYSSADVSFALLDLELENKISYPAQGGIVKSF